MWLVSRTLEKRETAFVLARTVPVRTTGETRVRVHFFFFAYMSFCVREIKVAWFQLTMPHGM